MKEHTLKEISEKKSYEPPKVEVIYVAMENGIAAESAPVSPGTNSNVDTDWAGQDDQTINTPF